MLKNVVNAGLIIGGIGLITWSIVGQIRLDKAVKKALEEDTKAIEKVKESIRQLGV